MIKIDQIELGDVFSEQSYYRVTDLKSSTVVFTHTKSGKEVELGHSYVTDLLHTADQYEKEVTIGLLDKVFTAKQIEEAKKKDPNFSAQVGDLKLEGIKTVWANVGSKVFTVCFEKKGKELSKTAYDKAIAKQTQDALDQINTAQTGRKGVAKTAAQVIEEVIRNPVTKFEKGEERILRGYKLQHESEDGFYQVADLDITTGDNKRLVNLNTAKWLVVGGVKYIKEYS